MRSNKSTTLLPLRKNTRWAVTEFCRSSVRPEPFFSRLGAACYRLPARDRLPLSDSVGEGGGVWKGRSAPPRWPCPLTGSPVRRVGGAFQVLCLTSRVGCVERAMWEGLRPPQPDSETPPSSQHTNFILCRTFKSRYHSQPALLRPALTLMPPGRRSAFKFKFKFSLKI